MPHTLQNLSREQHLALLLALFAVWCGISWYWYTCGIHGFCTTRTQETSHVSEIPLVPLTERAYAEEAVTATPSTPPLTVTNPLVIKGVPTVSAQEPRPATATTTTTCAPYLTYTLAPGTRREAEVRALERFLTLIYGARLAEDGMFGPHDKAAVRAYQEDSALTPTGSVDTDTLRAINRDACTHRDELTSSNITQ